MSVLIGPRLGRRDTDTIRKSTSFKVDRQGVLALVALLAIPMQAMAQSAAPSGPAKGSILGDTVQITFLYPTMQEPYPPYGPLTTVGVVSASGLVLRLNYQYVIVRPNSVEMNSFGFSRFLTAPFNGVSVTDLTNPSAFSIYSIDPATNLAGFTSSNVSLVDGVLYINYQSLQTMAGTLAVVDFNVGVPSLTIIQPADTTVIPYGGTYVATNPITFQADAGAANASAAISWTVVLSYATSAGRGAYSSSQTFSTMGNGTTAQTYTATGGKIVVNAAATIGGAVVNATPITIYVTGAAIPDSTITPELLSLYNGPTPRLLVGIADRESSYAQFRTLTLYGQTAHWPNESAQDGGSHIGLMQMATAGAGRSWNWMQNAIDGANWFSTKLGIAKSLVAQIRKAHPSLPDLTAVQYEQYAVELYGDHPGQRWSQQYWVPVQSNPADPKSTWIWQQGTANPLGTEYVNDVFSRVSLH